MATCPNKSLPEWKELERLHPDTCYYLWDKYEGYVPQEYYKEESTIKPGVEEVFESNSELANQIYSKILTNSGLSAENLLSLLLKDNLIEKQCS